MKKELPKIGAVFFCRFCIQVANYNFLKLWQQSKDIFAIRSGATGIFTRLLGEDATWNCERCH